jgi:cystathionine gamma-synthase
MPVAPAMFRGLSAFPITPADPRGHTGETSMMGLRPETLLAQAAGADDPTTGGIIPPLQPSTTFLRDPDNVYRRGFDYARDRNPTYAPAEAVLAALEGGAEALLFSSGMAAATAVFQALRPGDHVVAPRVIYWGLRRWLLRPGR